MSIAYCPACGTPVGGADPACPTCGHDLTASSISPSAQRPSHALGVHGDEVGATPVDSRMRPTRAAQRSVGLRIVLGVAVVVALVSAGAFASDATRPDAPPTAVGKIAAFLGMLSVWGLAYGVAGCLRPTLPLIGSRRRALVGAAACLVTFAVCALVAEGTLTPAQRQARTTAVASRQAEATARQRERAAQATATAETKAPESPSSSEGYADVDKEVGCKSTYSTDKKDDIFRRRYRDHWMTWRGNVVLASARTANLDLDDFGVQDLQVTFADKNAGYDLRTGDRITVRFLMKTAGGCLLPFGGEQASILK